MAYRAEMMSECFVDNGGFFGGGVTAMQGLGEMEPRSLQLGIAAIRWNGNRYLAFGAASGFQVIGMAGRVEVAVVTVSTHTGPEWYGLTKVRAVTVGVDTETYLSASGVADNRFMVTLVGV